MLELEGHSLVRRVAGCCRLFQELAAGPRRGRGGEGGGEGTLEAADNWREEPDRLPLLSPHPQLPNEVVTCFPQESDSGSGCQVSALLIRCLHQPKRSWNA